MNGAPSIFLQLDRIDLEVLFCRALCEARRHIVSGLKPSCVFSAFTQPYGLGCDVAALLVLNNAYLKCRQS
jgi:hypothetical protein